MANTKSKTQPKKAVKKSAKTPDYKFPTAKDHPVGPSVREQFKTKVSPKVKKTLLSLGITPDVGRPANQHAMGYTNREVCEVWKYCGGNVSETSRITGLIRATINGHLKRAGLFGKPIADGQLKPDVPSVVDLPRKGQVKRWILTSAQNNTKINTKVWASIQALADYYKAEILCASYSYNVNAYGPMAVKNNTFKGEETKLWYAPEIADLLEESDQNIELAPGLVWCGRMNIMPTAIRPLQGFETYTGRKSGIFPHTKLSMESIASGKYEATKFNYTTGTVTQINYIQKKAGLRAEHSHSYGGLLVEVDSDGRWFVRQLVADAQGTIYDLDICVKNGQVLKGQTVEAITWGDIHVAQLDQDVERIGWGQSIEDQKALINVLKPRYQFMHDVLDFRSRNHHDRKNPHKQYELWFKQKDSVIEEIQGVIDFLDRSSRPFCTTVVVDSNHDNAFGRWLRDTDWRSDPKNAKLYLEAQLAVIQAIEKEDDFHLLEWAVLRAFPKCEAQFLRTDESFVICRPEKEGQIGRDDGSGIECGTHGDLGPGGARGTPLAFTKIGRKTNIGHSHAACIIDGVYVAGVSGKLDMGYNVGPSNWSHSHIVTYKNGSRAIITMYGGKWRA